jgi:phosphate starvation-inducible PhoH-like protein
MRGNKGNKNNNPSSGTTKTSKIENLSIEAILKKKYNIKCKNNVQKDYVRLIKEKEITFCSGPAGTGKSYCAINQGILLLQNEPELYKKLLVVKPAVESEENLGFLPGDLKEKLEPHLKSSIDIVDKIVGEHNRISLEENRLLEVEPLGFIRGKTIDNSIVIIEEAQNMSPHQMKSLLTRIGENSKYIISGDINQSDKFKDYKKSGLYDAMSRHTNISDIGFFEFSVNDIVRNPIITKILNNYDENTLEFNKKDNIKL